MSEVKHIGTFTLREALTESNRRLRLRAERDGREWSEEYGGIVGKQHGGGPPVPIEKRITRYTHAPEQSALNSGEYYLLVDADDEALDDGTEVVEGLPAPDVRVARRLATDALQDLDAAARELAESRRQQVEDDQRTERTRQWAARRVREDV